MTSDPGSIKKAGPLDSFSEIHKKLRDKTTPATFKRGIIVAVYPQSGTADVSVVGSSETILKSVPLSSGINPRAVHAGDKCRIDMFDETNRSDSVIAYAYGRSFVTSSSGSVVYQPAGGISVLTGSIAHGLPSKPTIASISYDVRIQLSPTNYGVTITSIDATNINFTIDFGGVTTGVTTNTIYWFASIA